jgi:hypothetical protein
VITFLSLASGRSKGVVRSCSKRGKGPVAEALLLRLGVLFEGELLLHATVEPMQGYYSVVRDLNTEEHSSRGGVLCVLSSMPEHAAYLSRRKETLP